MTADLVLTSIVLVATLIGLMRERFAPDLLLLGAGVLLALVGVLSPTEALQGFSSPATFTFAALLVLSQGLRGTGAMDSWMHRRLEAPRWKPARVVAAATGLQLRLADGLVRAVGWALLLPTALGDVGTVAALSPRVLRLARRLEVSPSRLLLPMALAAGMGGALTLVGAAANLVVSGLLMARGEPALSLWSALPVVAPTAAAVVVGLILLGPRVLPERVGLLEEEQRRQREYLVEMDLQPASPLNGQTVSAAGLRHLPGLFLARIDRGDSVIAPVRPQEVLLGGDRLVFAGSVQTIRDVSQMPGLVPTRHTPDSGPGEGSLALTEAVVSDASPLVGSTVRDAGFRGRYNAAVVAVHRHGERLQGRLGDVTLRSGDTLLLQAGPGFARAFSDAPDFFVVSQVEQGEVVQHGRGVRAMAIALATFVAMGTGALPAVTACVVGAMMMVVSGCVSVGEARRAVKPSVLVTFALSFAFASALEKSGLAALFGAGLAAPGGVAGALLLTLLASALLTQFVQNMLAAALVLPAALWAARSLGAAPEPFALAVLVGVALAFATTRGYQTVRLVEGSGRYTAGDVFRLGAPLTLLGVGAAWVSLLWLAGGLP